MGHASIRLPLPPVLGLGGIIRGETRMTYPRTPKGRHSYRAVLQKDETYTVEIYETPKKFSIMERFPTRAAANAWIKRKRSEGTATKKHQRRLSLLK
jgi:hypothetical protein